MRPFPRMIAGLVASMTNLLPYNAWARVKSKLPIYNLPPKAPKVHFATSTSRTACGITYRNKHRRFGWLCNTVRANVEPANITCPTCLAMRGEAMN